MSIFAIGDLHLSFDERISKPMDIFGSRWENHAERLKQNWEENIGKDDTVLVCGDISWGLRLEEAMADFKWIESLPGRKIITKGNHDLWWGSIKSLMEIKKYLYAEREGGFVRERTALMNMTKRFLSAN